MVAATCAHAGKWREALPLFHEMEDILGKNAALCENIAHTYNSLGDYAKAEQYFRESLQFVESDPQMKARRPQAWTAVYCI